MVKWNCPFLSFYLLHSPDLQLAFLFFFFHLWILNFVFVLCSSFTSEDYIFWFLWKCVKSPKLINNSFHSFIHSKLYLNYFKTQSTFKKKLMNLLYQKQQQQPTEFESIYYVVCMLYVGEETCLNWRRG